MPEKTSYLPGEPTWIDLGTTDLDASVAFYCDLFGWTCDRGGDDVGGYSIFRKDGAQVAGAMATMAPEQPVAWSIYISTDDADKSVELVQSAGGTIIAPAMDVMDLGRMAVFADSRGAVLGLWQPRRHIGSELVDVEGVPCWVELASRDQDGQLPFYEAVFGWEAHRNPGYTELHLGEQTVAGCLDMPAMVPPQVPSYWMPYFQAQDPAAQAQRAATLGGTVLVPFMEMAQVAFSVVQDPQGATFGLLRPPSH
jgi:predicted enzyme related to lactoylglutathione lyase